MEKYRIIKETSITEEGELESRYVIEEFYPYWFRKGGSWLPRTREVYGFECSYRIAIYYKTLKKAKKVLMNLSTPFIAREIIN